MKNNIMRVSVIFLFLKLVSLDLPLAVFAGEGRCVLSANLKISQPDFRGIFIELLGHCSIKKFEQKSFDARLSGKMVRKNIELSASFLDVKAPYLTEAVRSSWRAGVERFHVDHMDGIFVGNTADGLFMLNVLAQTEFGSINSFGEQELSKRRPLLDVHLMVCGKSLKKELFAEFIDKGADILTFHFEAALEAGINPEDIIKDIRQVAEQKKKKIKVGISIKPETSFFEIRMLLPLVDEVLVMAVEPGAGGQEFLPSILEKISRIRDFADAEQLDLKISVDGGITRYYAQKAYHAGADVLVAGSTIFKQAVFEPALYPRASVKNSIDALRGAACSTAFPLSLAQQKRIVNNVIDTIEAKIKKISRNSDQRRLYVRILERYLSYRNELMFNKRVALMKYIYELSERTNERAFDDIVRILEKKILSYRMINFGDDGVFFRDTIVLKTMLKEAGVIGFLRDYKIWLGLPSDIELEGSVIFSESQGRFGKRFRFTVPDTARLPDYGILLNFAKISAIIVSDEQFDSMLAGLSREKLVAKYNIPVISVREAMLELELLRSARERFDRFNLLKEDKYEFKWINPIPTSHNLKDFNALKEGEIVIVNGVGNKYYGYVSFKKGRKYVTYLDTDNSYTGGILNANDFTVKEIKLLADDKDKITYLASKNMINYNNILRTNIVISLSEMGEKNFLKYLIELEDKLYSKPNKKRKKENTAKILSINGCFQRQRGLLENELDSQEVVSVSI